MSCLSRVAQKGSLGFDFRVLVLLFVSWFLFSHFIFLISYVYHVRVIIFEYVVMYGLEKEEERKLDEDKVQAHSNRYRLFL